MLDTVACLRRRSAVVKRGTDRCRRKALGNPALAIYWVVERRRMRSVGSPNMRGSVASTTYRLISSLACDLALSF